MASKTVFFDALAWGFVGFTALLVMGVLWLWWEQSRDVARDVARQKKTPPKISN